MGCAPSIHVSNGSVILCRDSDHESPRSENAEEDESRRTAVDGYSTRQLSYQAVTVETTEENFLRRKSSNVGNEHIVNTDISPTGTMKVLRANLNLPFLGISRQTSESQTQSSNFVSPNLKENREVRFGPMRIKLAPMKVLLVFGNEDNQSDAFFWAAEKLKYHCNLAKTPEAALESYLKYFHDLVIIDYRSSKHFDSDALCR